MERRVEHVGGGIVSLAVLVAEHGQALNYDLITRAGRSLYDIPAQGMTWADLRDFVAYLDASSALVGEVNPDAAGWQGEEKVPMLLAHIADTLSGLAYGYALTHMKRGSKKPAPPKPIPRPGIAKTADRERHFGSGAIPIADFDAWWNGEKED